MDGVAAELVFFLRFIHSLFYLLRTSFCLLPVLAPCVDGWDAEEGWGYWEGGRMHREGERVAWVGDGWMDGWMDGLILPPSFSPLLPYRTGLPLLTRHACLGFAFGRELGAWTLSWGNGGI